MKERSKAGHTHSSYDCDVEVTLCLTLHWPELDHMAMKIKMGNVVSTEMPSRNSDALSLV